ncbi:hypothetical protein N865_08690 [Intrasporangium oryzae NRRL B-24470]|uniref:Uncharacterized protein n=1 Tax=Intrasporangium oryzae NRRL B-24470 TaxID=1386089 RepID=W9GC10_9MICO|nr:hypothetical protein [Intrasporangium oryzae]EWT01394.1 hypothetical protein N865_08690 [Intrasporangium oryzae NRRL B-24470]
MSINQHLNPRAWPVRIVLGVVVVALLALGAHTVWSDRSDAARAVPQSTAMESALGIRFSRVAVVGDGGLVTLFYVVLDAEKANTFQSDLKHPPVLTSEARDGSTRRVSIMRPGHGLRPGSTAYLVYENTAGALRPNELVTISYGGMTLQHVPVL